jgi:hypothetical protein
VNKFESRKHNIDTISACVIWAFDQFSFHNFLLLTTDFAHGVIQIKRKLWLFIGRLWCRWQLTHLLFVTNSCVSARECPARHGFSAAILSTPWSAGLFHPPYKLHFPTTFLILRIPRQRSQSKRHDLVEGRPASMFTDVGTSQKPIPEQESNGDDQ